MVAEDDIKGFTTQATTELLRGLRDGTASLTSETTKSLVCTGDEARQLVEAAQNDDPMLDCRIVGNLDLWQVDHPLTLGGLIQGDLNIVERFSGTLHLLGTVSGDVEVTGRVVGSLFLHGAINGSLYVDGVISGDLKANGTVNGDIDVRGVVDGNLVVEGTIFGDLHLDDPVDDRHSGLITGDLIVRGKLAGNLSSDGSISGDLIMSGSIGGDLVVSGWLFGGLSCRGSITGDLTLRPTTPPQCTSGTTAPVEVVRLPQSVGGSILLGEDVTAGGCDFRGFGDFAKLRFVGSNPFPRNSRRRRHIDFNRSELRNTPFEEQAAIYRQLRQVFEKQGNRPAAGDFYYGETEARRNALRPDPYEAVPQLRLFVQHAFNALRIAPEPVIGNQDLRPEWLVLSIYKKLSGYGTRASYAFSWFVLVAIVGSWMFAVGGINLSGSYDLSWGKYPDGWSLNDLPRLILFTTRSMVSFLSPPQAVLSTSEEFLQLLLRFLGPVLLAQAALGIRERVAR